MPTVDKKEEEESVEVRSGRDTEPFERMIPGTQDMDFLLAHGHALQLDQQEDEPRDSMLEGSTHMLNEEPISFQGLVATSQANTSVVHYEQDAPSQFYTEPR